MRIGLKPVEYLTLVFTSLLAALTLAFLRLIPPAGWLLVRFGLVAAAIIALAVYTGNSRTWRPALTLRALLPVLIIPVLFDSLGDLIPWIRPRMLDEALIRIDHAMFGVHPTVWLERCIRPWLTTALQFAYISYYPMAVLLGVVLLARGKHGEFDEAVFGIVLCFFLSYIGYLAVPAIGPRFTLADVQTRGLDASPLVLSIQHALNTLENTKTDAFPSGHTAVALMTLYYAWRSREKVLAGTLLPVVSALIVSTVYLRYHYVIDVLAGIALAGLTIWLAPRVNRLFLRAAGHANDQFHDTP
jgi:membrane-associated phospholipid phosphatase